MPVAQSPYVGAVHAFGPPLDDLRRVSPLQAEAPVDLLDPEEARDTNVRA